MIRKDFLTPAELEKLIGISRRTLANWRSQKRGPEYLKINNRKVIYPRKAVERWIRKNAVQVKTYNG